MVMKYSVCVLLAVLLCGVAFAQDHSAHNQPKPATLMSGLGDLHHPVSTSNAEAQQFFDQGLRLIYAFNHDEAALSFRRAAELDPQNAVTAWRNFGIVLFNSGQFKECLEPLQKAVDLDPKNAQAWYLLGNCKVGAMEYKKEGDKMVPIVLPGTIEAYEKAIEFDPNGPWGRQSKEGLEQLKGMVPGIQTSVGMRKKKS